MQDKFFPALALSKAAVLSSSEFKDVRVMLACLPVVPVFPVFCLIPVSLFQTQVPFRCKNPPAEQPNAACNAKQDIMSLLSVGT